jgi:hypothetical protein
VNVAFDENLQVNPLHAQIATQLSQQLDELRKLDSEGFRAFVGPLLDDVAQGNLPHFPARNYERCRAAELRALVSPAGVFLCPRHQSVGVARYGDPTTTSLLQIWGSDAHKIALDKVNAKVHCSGACMSLELNERLNAAIAWADCHAQRPVLRDDDDLYI